METKKERELSLYDMFWAVCAKWRTILAVALFFALVATCFSYIKSVNEIETQAKNDGNDIEVESTQLYEKMTYEEQTTVDAYLNYKQTYNELFAYMENAPLMQLDANGFYKGRISFYVNNYYQVEYPIVQKVDNINVIVNSYIGVVNSEEFALRLADIINTKNTTYALEMVDVDGDFAGANTLDNDETRGLFSVWVYAANKDDCMRMQELVKESILGEKDEMTEQFGKHEIDVLQEEIVRTFSVELLEKQKKYVDMLYSCSGNMNTMAARFTDYQKNYLNHILVTDAMKAQEEVQDSAEELPTVSKKLILLGFLGGACLMFVFWALIYIFSAKLRLEEDFEKVFSSKLLGNVPMTHKKKKWFFFIDSLFENLRHFNRRYFDKEASMDMVLANIRIAMGNSDSKKIMITGAVCGEEEKEFAKILAERLKKDGIEIVSESSVLYNAEALEKLVDIGCVVLVEKAEKSLNYEIEKEIELCVQHGVSLIGTVVVY